MIELIEITDPPSDAMVRSFHCCICDKQHLKKGRIVRVWVGGAGGYASQAAESCWGKGYVELYGNNKLNQDLDAICGMIAGAVQVKR